MGENQKSDVNGREGLIPKIDATSGELANVPEPYLAQWQIPPSNNRNSLQSLKEHLSLRIPGSYSA